jgi:hypothetical protein
MMGPVLTAAESIERLERENEELRTILRDARAVIENPIGIPSKRRTLEAIDKVL